MYLHFLLLHGTLEVPRVRSFEPRREEIFDAGNSQHMC